MNLNKIPSRQRGFTLVEIAIVLVIIGLLLGGVLKGQEMIENARVKSVVSDMNGVSAAYNAYIDRYRAIPGDEVAATMTGRGWAGTAVGNANGALGVTPAQTFTNAGEQPALWRSLRASGLTSGDPAAPATPAGLPRAGTGGLMGVSVGSYALNGPTICIQNLTAKQAAGIDNSIDGTVVAPAFGNSTGTVRAVASAPAALVSPAPVATVPTGAGYDETAATLWTVCRSL